jgi:hypothetical protein
LHLVGDEHDASGNRRRSYRGASVGNVHELFDVQLVKQLAADPAHVAADVISHILGGQHQQWARGGTVDWTMGSFSVARDHVYARRRRGRWVVQLVGGDERFQHSNGHSGRPRRASGRADSGA